MWELYGKGLNKHIGEVEVRGESCGQSNKMQTKANRKKIGLSALFDVMIGLTSTDFDFDWAIFKI